MKFTELFSGIRSLRYGKRLNPVRDWLVLIACFAVLLAASAVWNAWTFIRIANGDVLGGNPPPAAPVFDRTALESVQSLFIERANEEAKYLAGSYRFVDPSQ